MKTKTDLYQLLVLLAPLPVGKSKAEEKTASCELAYWPQGCWKIALAVSL